MISILMPLYNGIEFLQDSITSIKKQSFKDWELLIGFNGFDIDEFNFACQLLKTFEDDRIKPIFCREFGKVKTLNLLKDLANYELNDEKSMQYL